MLQHITVVVSISQTFDVSSSVLLSPLSSSSLTTTSSPCHHYCYHLHPPLLNFIMTMTTIIPLQSLLFGHKTHAMLMSAYRYTLTLSVHSPSSLQASYMHVYFYLFWPQSQLCTDVGLPEYFKSSGHSPSIMPMSSYT